MGRGAPDWSKIFMIRALDEAGNLHDVRVDDQGRLVMLPYGTLTVDGALDVTQTDSERLAAGSDGVNQIPLAVDTLGRLVMIPYGYDGADYIKLKVNDEGCLIAIMTGSDGVDSQIILTDDAGRMIGVIRDPTNNNYLALDTEGRMTAVIKGIEGATLRTIAVDDGGRILAVFRDPASDNYAAISDDGYLSAILRGGSDIRLGLAGWWRIRASEGTTLLDASGNAHDGTARSGGAAGAVYQDGVVGESLYLDGLNDDIDLTNDAAFNFTTEPFTIEGWFRPEDLAVTRYVICRGLVNIDGWYVYLTSPGVIGFKSNQATTGQAQNSNPVFTSGEWQHLVITRSGDTVLIYRNSVDVTAAHIALVDPLTAARTMYFGRTIGGAAWFKGNIDELRIYDRCLSAEEVLWRYKRTYVSLDERYRPLAVDPEGRLEVSIADFAYKDQVLERGSTVYGGGGNQNEQSSVVPAGKMWVITVANAHSNGSACNSIDIGIYDGVDNVIIASDLSGANVFQANYQGQLILKPGDRLNFSWGHAATAYTTDWSLNGFELDYPY